MYVPGGMEEDFARFHHATQVLNLKLVNCFISEIFQYFQTTVDCG